MCSPTAPTNSLLLCIARTTDRKAPSVAREANRSYATLLFLQFFSYLMATMILPHQHDHGNRNCFPKSKSAATRPEIEKRRFQPYFKPLFKAEGHVRWFANYQNRTPQGDGILPLPFKSAQAGALSALSSLFKSATRYFRPSISPSFPNYGTFKRKPAFHTEGIPKVGFSIKPVQRYRSGINENCSASKKINNMKSSPRKRKASRKIASSGKVQHHNSSKVSKVNSTCIKSSDLCYKCKNADVKDKSNQGRNGSRQKNVKNDDRIEPPKVTILQRPESDEAAVKLFTEFFQTDTHETSKQSDRAFKSKIFGSSDLETDFGDHWHLDRSLDLNTSSLNASKTVGSPLFTNLPSPRNAIRGRDNPKATQDNKAFPSRSTQILVSTKLEMHADDGLVHDMKGFKYKSSCEEVDEERERWAGPSFVNSPPPCALPFPQFSKKHPEAVTSDNSHTQTLKGGAISDDLFKSDDLFSMSPMFTRHSYLNVSLDAMTSATNELKRLLNVGI